MKTIAADIKSRTFKRVYLLYGKEDFLRNSYKRQLTTAISGSDTMNKLVLEGKGIDLSQVKDFLDTMPFFADYRLVVLSDTGLFSSSQDGWDKMLADIPETSALVFCEREVDKRNKLFKAVGKYGYAASFETPSENELIYWIAQNFKRDGKVADRYVCENLLERCGSDMENLKNQIEKLISYTGERAKITTEDLDAVCTEQVTNQVFAMIDAATEGKLKKAFDLYQDMLVLNEKPLRIMYLIGRQCNILLVVRQMNAAGADVNTIGAEIGMRYPSLVRKSINQSKAFTEKNLKELVEMSVELEELVKTGRMDENIAVETALIQISRIHPV